MLDNASSNTPLIIDRLYIYIYIYNAISTNQPCRPLLKSCRSIIMDTTNYVFYPLRKNNSYLHKWCVLFNNYNESIYMCIIKLGPGAVVRAPAWTVGDRRFETRSAIQVSKKQKVSSPLICKDLILCGSSVTER